MEEKTRLFRRDFTLVVIGQIISLFGNAVLRFALPLYLLKETSSPALFGLVNAVSFAPMIFLSMAGGVLADRVNKRDIMVVLDFGTAALIGCFCVLLGKMPLVPLFITGLMLLYGISGTYQPAVQASIPLLVPEERLLAGNAVINQVSTLSGLLGPVLGGVMFGLWGIYPILLLGMVCFFASAVMEVFIHIPHKKRKGGQGVFAAVKADLGECYQFVRTQKPVFLSIVGLVCIFNLVFSAVIIVGMPVLITQILQMSDAMYGFAQGALALGGLCGGVITAAAGEKLKLRNSHRLFLACSFFVAVMGIILICPVSAMTAYLVITVMGFAVMGTSTVFVVQIYTMVQTETPPQLVGKIMAALISIAMCGQPVGQAIYGVLFGWFADQPQVVLLGAALLAALIALYAKRIFRQLADPAENPAEEQGYR